MDSGSYLFSNPDPKPSDPYLAGIFTDFRKPLLLRASHLARCAAAEGGLVSSFSETLEKFAPDERSEAAPSTLRDDLLEVQKWLLRHGLMSKIPVATALTATCPLGGGTSAKFDLIAAVVIGATLSVPHTPNDIRQLRLFDKSSLGLRKLAALSASDIDHIPLDATDVSELWWLWKNLPQLEGRPRVTLEMSGLLHVLENDGEMYHRNSSGRKKGGQRQGQGRAIDASVALTLGRPHQNEKTDQPFRDQLDGDWMSFFNPRPPIEPIVIQVPPTFGPSDFDDKEDLVTDDSDELLTQFEPDPQSLDDVASVQPRKTTRKPKTAEPDDGEQDVKPRYLKPIQRQRSNPFLALPIQNHRQAMGIIDQLSRHNVFAGADYRLPTKLETTKVFQFCWAEMSQAQAEGRHNSEALSVLFTILTGRTSRRLHDGDGKFEALHLVNTPHWCGIESIVSLPPKALSDIGYRLVSRESSGPLRLPLPRQLVEAAHDFIHDASALGISPTGLSSFLTGLRDQLSRPAVETRFGRHLEAHLTQHGVDRALIAHIVGLPPSAAPQLNYSRIFQADAVDAWRQAVDPLFEAAGVELKTYDASLPVYAGTRLVPEDYFLKGVFEVLKTRASLPMDQTTPSVLETAHNARALELMLTLMLATGIRAIRSPFETIDRFDLTNGWVLMCDKFNRASDSYRELPLPKAAIGALVAWTDDLRNLRFLARDVLPRVAQAADHALTSHGPILFLIEDGEPIAMTPSQTVDFLEDLLPLPMNWNRHYVRSKLIGKVRSELIDAFMSHADLGAEAQGPMSGLPVSDLWEVADAIDDLLSDLGIGQPSHGTLL